MNINEIESVLECFLFPKVGCSIDEFVQQVAKECKPPNGPWIKMLSGTDRKTEPTNLIAILSDTFDQHLYTLLFNVPNREILIVDPLLDKHDPVNNNSITEFNDKVSLKLQKVLLEFIKLKMPHPRLIKKPNITSSAKNCELKKPQVRAVYGFLKW
jgi:hypothetical protein